MSANNLALMYMNGDGVIKNLKQAEQLFICAMNYGDPNAMDNIVLLYLKSGNISKAEKWNEESIKQGSKTAHDMKKAIAQTAPAINASISGIIDWEKELNLPFENMTTRERVVRKHSYKHPDESEAIFEFLDDMESLRHKSEYVSPFKITNDVGYKYDLKVLANRKDTSVFSNRMYFAVLNFMGAIDAFCDIANRSIVVLDYESRTFINRLAACYKLEHFVGTIPLFIREDIRKIVLQLLAQSDRIVEHSDSIDELAFNQDCRICHSVLNMQSDETIDFLTECIKKYPNNTFFLELRGCLYNFIPNYECALRDFNRIDEISKDDVDNLYDKAATLRLMGRSDQAIDAYTKFLSVASVDHRKEKQIPFFLPYESTSKEFIELAVPSGVLKGKGKPVIKGKPAIKGKPVIKDKPIVKPVDPLRKDLIVNHRRYVSEFRKIMSNDKLVKGKSTATPSKCQSAPLSWVGLKPIYLNEINPTSDRVLEGYVLELTLITEPFNNN
ncbi:hypothetical protein BGW38_008349, partial [Lunasporangiospora selenospora]